MLLNWLSDKRGRPELANAAQAIEEAVDGVVSRPQTRTADIGAVLGTAAFAEHVCERLRSR